MEMNHINNPCLISGAVPKRPSLTRHFSVWLISLLSLVLLGVLAPSASAAEETLTNDSIVRMKGKSFGDGVIIARIKASTCNFDTSDNGLDQLKAAHISDEVIQAMITSKTPPAAQGQVPPIAASDPNDPNTPHAAGVWVWQEINGKTKMTQVETEPSVGSSSGGFIGPYGIGRTGQSVHLSGARSDLQLTENQPVFYFYIGRAQQADGAHEFSSARSAKDFTLAKFTVKDKDNERVLEVGRSGGYGGSSGIAAKDRLDFTSEKVADGIYKIVPKEGLANAEYSFCRAISKGHGEFFTFGVQSTITTNAPTAPAIKK